MRLRVRVRVRVRVSDAASLLQAGATEVVVESVEAAVRFATLLGTPAEAADSLLRAPLTAESLLVATKDASTPDSSSYSSGLRQAHGRLSKAQALTLTLTLTLTLALALALTLTLTLTRTRTLTLALPLALPLALTLALTPTLIR